MMVFDRGAFREIERGEPKLPNVQEARQVPGTDTGLEISLTRLSLAMIVRNEASHLAACLATVSGLADEVVVVDTGSSGGTTAIAASHGASVFHLDWQADFAWPATKAWIGAPGTGSWCSTRMSA